MIWVDDNFRMEITELAHIFNGIELFGGWVQLVNQEICLIYLYKIKNANSTISLYSLGIVPSVSSEVILKIENISSELITSSFLHVETACLYTGSLDGKIRIFSYQNN